jgi:transaldolase
MEFWVNNPSGSDMQMALDAGAVGVASNPKYIDSLLKSEAGFVHEIIDEVLEQQSTSDREQMAMQVIQKAVSRPLKLFHPLYKESNGRYGYVAIQGNPRRNHDLGAILEEAEKFHDLGENIIIKQPSTVEGAQSMEELTARGWSTIGTMSFSVAQYIYMAEAHRRGLKRTNKRPRCLITMLPGMFDEYLAEDAARRGIKVSPEVISQAGISTARAAYKVFHERNYEAIILAGGARSMFHWTELVGRGIAATLSGKLTNALIQEHPPVVRRIHESAPPEVTEELRQKFPNFIRACDEDSMVPEEFRNYGPVVRFQNALLDGFSTIMKEIQSRNEKRTQRT